MQREMFSNRQLQILHYVARIVLDTGEGPEISQLAADLGFTHRHNATKAVKQLMDRGYFTPFNPETGLFALTGKPYPPTANPILVAPPKLQENWTKPKPDRSAVKKRKCLGGCGKPFTSQWAGERICPNCKGQKSWQSGAYGMEVSINV